MVWRDKAKLAMRVQDITQEKMAEHLGVSQGGIGHWLNGRREPSLDVLEQISIPCLLAQSRPSNNYRFCHSWLIRSS